MQINRNNYEVYFLDYIEGSLSPDMVAELQIFLALNPDLDDELRGVDQSVLTFNEEVFEAKDLLKKAELPILQEDLDLLLMKELDGEASADEIAQLDRYAAQFAGIAAQRSAMQKSSWIADPEYFDFKDLLRIGETPDMSQTDMLLAGAVEGDLTTQQQLELTRRMQSDASVVNALDQMKRAVVVADDIAFESKADLAIPGAIDFSDVRNLIIAKVEGDLTKEQNEKLSAKLAQDPALREELRRFYQARLTAEEVVFEGKSDLRQKETPVIPLRRILTIVSSLAAVLVMIFWINSSDGPVVIGGIAEVPVSGINKNNDNDKTTAEKGDGKESEMVIPGDQQVVKPGNTNEDQFAHQVERNVQPNQEVNEVVDPQRIAPIRAMKTRLAPENAFASVGRKGLAVSTLDMSGILGNETTVEVASPIPGSNPATIWQLFSKAAEERLEKTAAYALVERQVEKVTPQNPDRFRMERVELEDKSQLKMKVGKFEVSRDTKKRSTGKGPLERIIDRFVKE